MKPETSARRLLSTLAGLCGLAAGAPALAQANYVEPFDDLGETNWSTPGPQPLIDRGWEFRNQSQPVGSRGYFSGILPSTNSGYFGPQSGPHYLAVDSGVTNITSGGPMSAWAILPPIPNQIAGDTFTIWLRRLGDGVAGIEIRYSPSGGTGTGSGPSGMGDFSQVLLSASPVGNAGWVRHQAALPGSGRIAIRYLGTFGGLGNFNPYVGIDSLSIGPVPPPACNLPPIPQPGQTVAWTAAGGPYMVCEDIAIPPGGTVNVEPGASVQFQAGRQLAVAGTLNINGTAAAPVILSAPNIYPPFILVQDGTLNANFADFRHQVRVGSRSNVFLRDCTFTSDGTNLQGGMLTSDSFDSSTQPFVLLERCTFTRSLCILSDCLVRLKNNTFNETTTWLLRGYADVTSPNSFSGKALEITREHPIQHLRVDGIQATSATPAGVSLDGGSYLLGPNLSLQNNPYPARVIGGLLPGSTLPATGNVNNAVDAFHAGFRGEGRWSDVGIPYRLTELGENGGNLFISPGVVVEGLAGADLFALLGRRIIAEGTAQRPIIFRSAIPGQQWGGLFFDTNANAGPRLDHCIVSGATQGVAGVDTPSIYVDNTTFQSNAVGAIAGFNTRIHFAKTLFTGNSVGVQRDGYLLNQTNPNAFEGNTVAVEGRLTSTTHAEACWWNSPSGPSGHPQNPGGTGDPIGGTAGSVSIFPFLTQRPDFANTPPTVRIKEPGLRGFATLQPGQKYILEWEAEDNGAIASQRVLISPDGVWPAAYTITVADNLPGTQRCLEFVVPEVGFAVTNSSQFLKIEATDNTGQVGFDHMPLVIPSGRLTGDLTFSAQTIAAFVGRTFTAGQPIPNVTWTSTVGSFPSYDLYLLLEGDAWYIAGYSGNPGSFFEPFPNVSTDTARIAVRARNNSNDVRWFYTGYFSIRHDARLGFTPPTVQLQSPAAGASFPGGASVPITWTASASEGFYSFDIQASYDGGREWYAIARDLPAAARNFDWHLPASTGIADARVRVIGRDLRFQNSSDGSGRSFAITPGSGPAPCYANCDGSTTSPMLNVNDFICFQQKYAANDPYANCDSSTAPPVLNVNDFICFQTRFAQGCP